MTDREFQLKSVALAAHGHPRSRPRCGGSCRGVWKSFRAGSASPRKFRRMILNRNKQRQSRCCRRLFAATVFLCSCLVGFSQTNSFFQFVQGQSERHYTQVPHEVLAVYYLWYGYGNPPNGWDEVDTNKHVIAKTARYPVKGAYKSDDVAIIDWHIDQAKAHGITGFVVSWFGKADQRIDGTLALLVERAEKKDFKIAVYWENQRDGGALMRQFAVDDLSYIVEHYGKSKAFLKIDGKPVIFVYGRVMYQTPVALWPEIVEEVRARAGDFALIADGYQTSYAYLFDGLHTYDPAGLSPDTWNNLRVKNLGSLRTWAANHYEKGVKMARQHGRIACVMVTPGCDARKAYKIKEQSDRLNGQTYRTLWDEALKAQPDWVLITSWNEWPEGTEIEPSLELGDKYLNITAEYSQRFLGSPAVSAPKPTPLPDFSSGPLAGADKALLGRKVSVLMTDRMNDSEFWAACCGATIQRMGCADLINSKVFNASNFPVLIQIGGEHYNSSVNVTDDVTRALVRYLHEGGFLVCLPTGTWPLLYDDSRKGVPHGITDILDLGIDNGFEQPPAGADLKFYVNKQALFGLPSPVSFPTNGDLRFRPINHSRVSPYDFYQPLVELWDGQKHYVGDAAAYVEHRTPSLLPGKSIYVWMRTAEALGPDEFYPSLYQFISTKLKPLSANNP
jgi:glycoprotein endo-alpha-1,2-mannosidase